MADWTQGFVDVFSSTGSYVTSFEPAGNAHGVAINSAGTTVYADTGLSVNVFSITAGSPPTYTQQIYIGAAGGPEPSSSPLNSTNGGIRIDNSGNVWVADEGNNRIVEYSVSGTFLQAFTDSSLPSPFNPWDLVLDGSGNVYAVDETNNIVEKFNSSGTVIAQFGAGILNQPIGITTDGSGNFYIANGNPGLIYGFH